MAIFSPTTDGMAWLPRSNLDSLLVPHRATIVSPEHGQPRNHTYAVGHAVLSGEQPTSPFADDEAAGYEKKNSGVCCGPRYPLILLAAHYDRSAGAGEDAMVCMECRVADLSGQSTQPKS